MDFQNTNLQGGSLQISTEVIGKIARCAALEIDGVAEVSCGKQNKKLKDLLEASSIQSPVTVEMRDGTASITLNLMVSFGARIPAVAEKVQENVKTAMPLIIFPCIHAPVTVPYYCRKLPLLQVLLPSDSG